MLLIASYTLGAAAQFCPEIDALMAYVDSMKQEQTGLSLSNYMTFGVGRTGLECQGRLSFQHSYIEGHSTATKPEWIALQKQKMEEMLNRVRQTLDHLSKQSIEASHWEMHSNNADTLNYAMYLRPAQQMFSLRKSTNSRFGPSAAFGGEYINMNYYATRDIPYYPERNYKKDEQTGKTIVEVDSSVVASYNIAHASLNYFYYLDSAFVNNPDERGVQLFVTPFNPDTYCEAIQKVLNRPGVVMRQVHYYKLEGNFSTGSTSDSYGNSITGSFPFITESDTYGLHYIIQSKEVAETVIRDYWKATIDYILSHPHEDCHAINPNRCRFGKSAEKVFYGQHDFRVYQLGWNDYSGLSDTNYFDVLTAYSKGYYHILLLKTNGGRLHNLPKDWETIRDYDNGVVTYYEEDF